VRYDLGGAIPEIETGRAIFPSDLMSVPW